MHRTAEFIEETKAQAAEGKSKPEKRPKSGKLLPNGLSPDIGKATQFKPGNNANPGGRPKRDIAADIARAVFETSEPEAIQAFRNALLKGNAYTFKELAERGYGKLQEKKEVTHVYQEVPDADLQRRVDSLIRDLGLAAQVDAAGGTQGANGRAEETHSEQEDTAILS